MFGGVGISESVVVTWIIMAALTLLSILLVRNLRVENVSRKQLLLESAVGWIYNFFKGILGEAGKRYIPYLMTVVVYIGVANLIGLLGFKPQAAVRVAHSSGFRGTDSAGCPLGFRRAQAVFCSVSNQKDSSGLGSTGGAGTADPSVWPVAEIPGKPGD